MPSGVRKWSRSATNTPSRRGSPSAMCGKDGMDTLKKLEKDGHHSLDDTRIQSDELQKLTDATIKEIDEMLAAKEREIMQV